MLGKFSLGRGGLWLRAGENAQFIRGRVSGRGAQFYEWETFMIFRHAALIATLCLCGTSANALTMKECSAKYKASQTAGTLNGQKWNDFRKAECGSDAAATPAAASVAAPVSTQVSAPAKPAASTTSATGNATFPSAVSPKYSSEKAGKARMHTCLDQYNKDSNANGGLKWIAKGGGYYSACAKHLKG
jgi:uncharacterized membrane protein